MKFFVALFSLPKRILILPGLYLLIVIFLSSCYMVSAVEKKLWNDKGFLALSLNYISFWGALGFNIILFILIVFWHQLSHVRVVALLIRRVLEWTIGFIAPYTYTARDYRQYSAIAHLHTFQFTVTHALGLSVFTSRILVTDLSQSHCHFSSHMNPSWHSLIPFLTFLLSHLGLTSPELDPVPLD
jgi:hypothetical protein